jgi:hypothetical protein
MCAKDLAVCFANRGLLANYRILDAEAKADVHKHFCGCGACRAWAEKHRLLWRILLR